MTGITTPSGSVRLVADNLEILQAITTVAGGTIELKPLTSDRGINLGTETVGALSLTDAELDLVTAGTFQFGEHGEIIVTDAITRAVATDLVLLTSGDRNLTFIGTASLDANGGDVSIFLGPDGTGSVISGAAEVDVFADDLFVRAGAGGIGLPGNPFSTSVNTLATDTNETVDGQQFLFEADTLTIAGSDIEAGTETVFLEGGVFVTDAQGTFDSPIHLTSGATLAGTGTTGPVNAVSGGTVAPGASPGILTTGNLALEAGGIFATQIEGPAGAGAANGHDQVAVNGSVSLGGVLQLDLTGLTAAEVVQAGRFLILLNDDSTDAITGTFATLPEGAVVSANFAGTGRAALITYKGGDGNDVEIFLQPLDFGDAPDPRAGTPGNYPTLFESNGARHIVGSGPILGSAIDAEVNGQPDPAAQGDGADDDGVTLPASFLAGLGGQVQVTASAAGLLDAWIDFDGDGVFEAGEQIASSRAVSAGVNTVTFSVPQTAAPGTTFARFRISTAGGLQPTGQAADGEVEDYQVQIEALPVGATLIDDPINPGQSVLVINGTNGGDRITVSERRGVLHVQINRDRTRFDVGDVDRIVVFGRDGHDRISIARSVDTPATIDGGADHDRIRGGTGNSVLLGGPGNDHVTGGRGRNVLIGGAGADTLRGGRRDDVLVGGATTHDSADSSLQAILAAWTSSESYLQRVNRLRSGSGVPPLNAATILPDAAVDRLFGSRGLDWYLVGPEDDLPGLAAEEQVDAL